MRSIQGCVKITQNHYSIPSFRSIVFFYTRLVSRSVDFCQMDMASWCAVGPHRSSFAAQPTCTMKTTCSIRINATIIWSIWMAARMFECHTRRRMCNCVLWFAFKSDSMGFSVRAQSTSIVMTTIRVVSFWLETMAKHQHIETCAPCAQPDTRYRCVRSSWLNWLKHKVSYA